MRIVVLVKHVPDALPERGFTAGLRCDREVEGLLSEIDEYALQQASDLAGKDAEVVAVTVGPPDASGTLRRALAMGAGRGVHVYDPALAGSDALGTARVLAAAVDRVARDLGPVDLVLTGAASTDAGTALVPVQLATLLGLPVLAGAATVAVADGRVRVTRAEEHDDVVVSASLPAVVSVTDRATEPSYPTLRATMGARRKPVERWTLADLGLPADRVGSAGAATAVRAVEAVPPRQAGRVVHDDGTAGRQLADFLAGVTG